MSLIILYEPPTEPVEKLPAFSLDLRGPVFIIIIMKVLSNNHRWLIPVCLAVCLTAPAVGYAQVARRHISSAIPLITAKRSTIPVYLIAFISFAGVVAVAMRSANRGKSRGGRD